MYKMWILTKKLSISINTDLWMIGVEFYRSYDDSVVDWTFGFLCFRIRVAMGRRRKL